MHTVKGDVNGVNDFFEVHVDREELQNIIKEAENRNETIQEYFNNCVLIGLTIRLGLLKED